MAYRLRDVELYIGLKTKTFKQYGFHKGVVGATYTFELAKAVHGQFVRITRSPSIIDILTLCEVQVMGSNTFQSKKQIIFLLRFN